MEENKIFQEVAKRATLTIYNQFNISSQFNSDPLIDFTFSMEFQQYKELLPKVSNYKIRKAIRLNRQIPFLLKNGITGFVCEVYQEKLIEVDKEGQHIFNSNHHHITIMHDQNYDNLMNRIFAAYDENLKIDIENFKRKKQDAKKSSEV